MTRGCASLARRVLPEKTGESRSVVVERYRPALRLAGDAVRGRETYRAACVSCHRYREEGFAVGPDLVTFKQAGDESILTNLFDPNREVAPQYQAFQFTLESGETLLGMIESETTTGLTIVQPFGESRKVRRADVSAMSGLKRSLMPEGLEAALSPRDVADLLAFIREAK